MVLFCFVLFCLFGRGKQARWVFLLLNEHYDLFFSRNLGVQIIPFKLKKNLNMVIGRKRDMAKSVHEALT